MKGVKSWKKELQRLNIPFEQVGNFIYLWGQNDFPYTKRQVWKVIRAFHTTYKRDLKHYGNRKNRRKTTKLLNSGQTDNIPHNKPAHKEDPWSWD